MSMSAVSRMLFAASATVVLSGSGVFAQSLQFDLNRGQIGIVPPRDERRLQREDDEDRRGSRQFEERRSGVSCSEGRRILRQRGFSDVRPVQCSGRNLVYTARERGEPVEVRVSARDGRIVSVEGL